MAAGTTQRRARPRVVRLLTGGLVALEQLPGAFGTAAAALGVLLSLLAAAVTSLAGVGLLALPLALRGVHAVADRERARLGRWGPDVVGGGGPPPRLRAALADPAPRRELRWPAGHATVGLLAAAVAVLLPVYAARDLTFPLWWWLLPPEEASDSLTLWSVRSWPDVVPVVLLGTAWAVLTVLVPPVVARLLAGRGRRLLGPAADADLSLRVHQLTTTRAAALDAHAAELRRIERSLHDGTQNRLVAVTVLLGAARRATRRDPVAAEELLERAQTAAEEALAELRAVARGILPPVLADRGLAGALAGLAATSPVPCRVDVEVAGRCAASVEATAWFAVAEALTNVARHSDAGHASVTVRGRDGRLTIAVTDDGRVGPCRAAGPGWSASAAGDAAGPLAALDRHGPDVAIVDVRMPPTHTDEGIVAAVEARRRRPDLAVLVLSAYVEQFFATELLAGGAAGLGYLLKERVGRVEQFLDALQRVAAGGTAIDPEAVAQLFAGRRPDPRLDRLSPREREVLALMAEGLGDTAIGERLVVTDGAVHKHIRSIFAKLDLSPDDRRVAAVLRYLDDVRRRAS